MQPLILFDCDGTLTDSHSAIVHAMQQAFVSSGLPMPQADAVKAIIGLSLTAAIERLMPTGGGDAHAVAAAYRLHYREAEAGLALYPGVIETLVELRARGYWMGVVTGKSRPGLLRVLERFALNDYFLVWRTADCCPSKPHPAMVEECMAELGVVPKDTTVIGDARFDMQLARAAGARAIGVSFGVETAEVLHEEGAETVVDRFPDLLAYFPPLNGGTHSAKLISMSQR
jgi:phosphoglycolate phosphatase